MFFYEIIKIEMLFEDITLYKYMSYRNYLLKSLNRNDLMNATKSAPEGVRYCNALCQDFRPNEEFSNNIPTCKNCRNKINLAEKQIREGTITLEEFKNNPDIVNGIEIVFDTNKFCNICKQEKSINQFESSKNVCRACRSIQAVNRANKDIDIIIADVEKAKNNLIVLENFVKSIAKDKLVKVISHFEIGRKSTDKKENMVYNVVQHFKKLLQPKLCQGGCGASLQVEFTTCLGCENKKDKPRAVSKMINFTENIDDVVENLTEITKETFDTYNREQLYRIHEKLTGVKPKQKTLKEEVIEIINQILKKRNIEREKQKLLEQSYIENKIGGGEITLNGISVLAREDGFINATAMCKAGKKLFGNWYKSDPTKELIKVLEEKIKNDTDIHNQKSDIHYEYHKIIDIKKGNSSTYSQGSWIHPDLAVHLAMWISPAFGIQVSGWVRELALTGMVIVGEEKTHHQLLALQNEVIKQRDTIKSLEIKHSKFLEKREYHKFKEGPVFYIISDGDSKSIKFKPGVEGNDINRRLAEHRSTTPAIKLEYLIYTKDNIILEKNILKRYKVKRTYQNHEWIYEISKEHIIDSVNSLVNFLNIEYTEEKNLGEYNKDINGL
jgi:exonuclease VII small subunit